MTTYSPSFSESFDRELRFRFKRDRATYDRIIKKVKEILDNPSIGKPLEHDLFGKRRVHIGHFVLTYKINEQKRTIIFDGFEHHDVAY
ncbi:MAG: type II toxin-antitoxin system RelE/ParE family toxin [Candidatus Micrarchaeota archaeon]|nr:type II toxin-antitoxin system RelE/ParE family toxin [Candidatus Micrarchaeota archaeon]